MGFDTALYSRLHAGGVAALVSDRIYPSVAKEGATFPMLVYTLVSAVPSNTLDGDDGLDNALVQVDAIAETFTAAKALADAVRALMTSGSDFRCVPQGVGRAFFDPDAKKHVIQQDYSIWITAV